MEKELRRYLSDLGAAGATMALIALSLIALAHGLERQAGHNLAVVAEHLEGR